MTTAEKIEAIRIACIEANPSKVWEHEEPAGMMSDQTITTHDPCRLSDVLLAMPEGWALRNDEVFVFCDGAGEYEMSEYSWNLAKDSLYDQEEATIDFIHQVLFGV